MLHLHRIQPHQRRIAGFLLLAVLVHALLFIGLWDHGLGLRPKLPAWMNIKLMAGIDESPNRTRQDPTAKPMNKSKPETVENNRGDEPVQVEARPETVAQQAEAQYFVQADSRPFAQQNPKPLYPAAARRRGMQGTVVLRVKVNVSGRVSHIALKKSSRFRLLDHAALSSVKHWRFIPAKRNGQVVESIVEIPIRFALKKL